MFKFLKNLFKPQNDNYHIVAHTSKLRSAIDVLRNPPKPNFKPVCVLNIANDFSRFPSGKTFDDSDHCGQALKLKIVDLIKNESFVIIELDGTFGYSVSFLQEAFGGLVRDHLFSEESLKQKIRLVSSSKSLVAEIWYYIAVEQVNKTNIIK